MLLEDDIRDLDALSAGNRIYIIDATGEQVRVLRKGRIGVKEVQDAWQD